MPRAIGLRLQRQLGSKVNRCSVQSEMANMAKPTSIKFFAQFFLRCDFVSSAHLVYNDVSGVAFIKVKLARTIRCTSLCAVRPLNCGLSHI